MPALIMRRLERADAGHFEVVDQVAGGKHRRRPRLAFVGAGSRNSSCISAAGKGHAVEFEVAGFLHLRRR